MVKGGLAGTGQRHGAGGIMGRRVGESRGSVQYVQERDLARDQRTQFSTRVRAGVRNVTYRRTESPNILNLYYRVRSCI